MTTERDVENAVTPGPETTALHGTHGPLGSRLQRVRAAHSYGFVLLLFFATFVFISLAPDATWATCVVVLLLTAVLLASIWTSGLREGTPVVGIIATLGIVATAALVFESSNLTQGLVGLLKVGFLVGSCGAIALGVFDQQQVNRQSVLGAVCVYLALGLMFATLYGAVAALDSRAFFVQGNDGTAAIRVYFSFVTLATLGYGDYTAGTDLGRMLSVVEALIGQLYLVTVVAVLVANLGRPKMESK